MTNSKNTKRALLASVLSIVVCAAMLIGSTFAWFTDSVTSGRNIIQAGNLDISASYRDVDMNAGTDTYKIPGFDRVPDGVVRFSSAATDINKDNAIITEDLWEPGAVGAKLITVKNAGSLAAKIKLSFAIEDGGLQNALWFDFVQVADGAVTGTFTEREMSALAAFANAIELPLMPNGEVSFVLLYGMKETAGNEYMDKSFSADVAILAAQYTYEEDGFGKDYDEGAAYPFTVNGEPVFLKQSENGLYENAEDPTDETMYVADQDSLAAFRELVNVKNSAVAQGDIALAADVVMEENWEPVGTGATSRFAGTFDGGGHRIINMAAHNNLSYGNAFFGDLTSGAVIKNLTFTNAYVSRYGYDSGGGNVYGIVAAYAYGNVTFENVHVRNSKVAGFGKVGALLGMAADPSGTTKLIDCSVEDTTIVGAYNCGAFIGLAQNKVEMENCTAKNVTWQKFYPAEDYIDVDTTVSVGGEEVPMKGIYWTYSSGDSKWVYAAWGDCYTDYSLGNNNPAATMTFNGVVYSIADGFCH